MKRPNKITDPERLDVSSSDPIARRDFFKLAWKWLGVVVSVELLAMLAVYSFSGKKQKAAPPRQLFDAGPVDAFSRNTVTAFMGGRFYLARQQDGGFIALSLRCTHLGCSVTWEEDKNRFICPCHSSAFNIKGEVLNPPAARALSYYPVYIENGAVKVDIGTIIKRNSFDNNQLVYA
jgi:cytochrome b6-f complex iron-sulfur subunit